MPGAFEPVWEDKYRFLGHDVAVSSNSKTILEDLKSVYDRFWLESRDVTLESTVESEQIGRTVRITNRIEDNRELLLEGLIESHRLKCLDLMSFDLSFYRSTGTVSDPLTYIRWYVLKNVCKIVGDFHLFHAGVVSWEGQGIILPGESGMGKTTTTLNLVRHGFRFLSDEVACIRVDDGDLEPFIRKLNLSDHSRRLLGLPPWDEIPSRPLGPESLEWTLDIESIIPDCIGTSCPLRFAIFLNGFGESPRMDPIPSSNALFKLVRHSLSDVGGHASFVYRFASIMDRIDSYHLVAGDPKATATLIRDTIVTAKGS